jgi:hypothetical protein
MKLVLCCCLAVFSTVLGCDDLSQPPASLRPPPAPPPLAPVTPVAAPAATEGCTSWRGSQCVRRYFFTGNGGACASEGDYDEMQMNMLHRDKEALNDMQRRGVCFIPPEGMKATIIHAGLTTVEVRAYHKNRSAALWTSWDALGHEDVGEGYREVDREEQNRETEESWRKYHRSRPSSPSRSSTGHLTLEDQQNREAEESWRKPHRRP